MIPQPFEPHMYTLSQLVLGCLQHHIPETPGSTRPWGGARRLWNYKTCSPGMPLGIPGVHGSGDFPTLLGGGARR